MKNSQYQSEDNFNPVRTEILCRSIRYIEMREDLEIDQKAKMIEIRQIIAQEGKLSSSWE
jgi:hypothetical protein